MSLSCRCWTDGAPGKRRPSRRHTSNERAGRSVSQADMKDPKGNQYGAAAALASTHGRSSRAMAAASVGYESSRDREGDIVDDALKQVRASLRTSEH